MAMPARIDRSASLQQIWMLFFAPIEFFLAALASWRLIAFAVFHD